MPPLRQIDIRGRRIWTCIYFDGPNWLSQIETLTLVAFAPHVEVTVRAAAPSLKKLTLSCFSADWIGSGKGDGLPDCVILPLPDLGNLPVLETLELIGPGPADVPLAFLERMSQWPRLRHIIVHWKMLGWSRVKDKIHFEAPA
ncbi:hypothetical protein GGF32_005139, partial [Allomyces javanicus]